MDVPVSAMSPIPSFYPLKLVNPDPWARLGRDAGYSAKELLQDRPLAFSSVTQKKECECIKGGGHESLISHITFSPLFPHQITLHHVRHQGHSLHPSGTAHPTVQFKSLSRKSHHSCQTDSLFHTYFFCSADSLLLHRQVPQCKRGKNQRVGEAKCGSPVRAPSF